MVQNEAQLPTGTLATAPFRITTSYKKQIEKKGRKYDTTKYFLLFTYEG